jgi:sugar phosphate isomerase/epimerase
VKRIGYAKVQTNMSLAGHDTAQLKQAFDDAGLAWDAAHCSNAEFLADLPRTIERANAVGLRYLVTSVPLYPANFRDVLAGVSADAWKRNAELLNKVGGEIARAGLVFGYHNHNPEFRKYDGVTAYDALLKETDPQTVKLELDIGWMMSGGYEPAEYLTRYPGRYIILHVKDLTRDFIPNVRNRMTGKPAGSGIVDWKKLFAAAREAGIKGLYVEQEAPYQASPLEDAKLAYDFLSRMT